MTTHRIEFAPTTGQIKFSDNYGSRTCRLGEVYSSVVRRKVSGTPPVKLLNFYRPDTVVLESLLGRRKGIQRTMSVRAFFAEFVAREAPISAAHSGSDESCNEESWSFFPEPKPRVQGNEFLELLRKQAQGVESIAASLKIIAAWCSGGPSTP